MATSSSRRQFLQRAAALGAVAGLGDLSFLARLGPVSAAESAPNPNLARLHPDIEPVVRLIEETPRDTLLEVIAKRIHDGLGYQDVLAGLLLAGVRNVQPRPVGFKFHAVLVVNSAHLASIASPDEHRWLPIFWALDHFKQSQAENRRQGDWHMAAVNDSALPTASGAVAAFTDAMDRWDEAGADVAAAAMTRNLGMNEVFEIFFRYGARDFRDIGHKAIYVANSMRTLNTIGYQHAEPVVRSLAYALLAHEGDNPAKRDDKADRPWRQNVERAASIRKDWLDGRLEPSATRDMLATLRQANEEESCLKVVELLNRNVHPHAIWDALLVGAGELMVRQPGIVALHAVTTTNALRYAFETSASDDTRRMMLLQNAAFVPMFRQQMAQLKPVHLDELPSVPIADASQPMDEIFAEVSGDRMKAAGKVIAYLEQHPQPQAFVDRARLLIFLKGTNAHDYKYSAAVLEDHAHLSPQWRARYLASSVFNLKGTKARDNALVTRIRAALG